MVSPWKQGSLFQSLILNRQSNNHHWQIEELLLAMSFLYLATGTFDFLELREMAGGGDLATKIAAFVTGVALPVDGGATL